MSSSSVTQRARVPEKLEELDDRARELGILQISMSQLPIVRSASKLEEAQFICLRAVWPRKRDARELDEACKFNHTMSERVDEVMNDFHEFDLYCDHIGDHTKDHPDRNMGVFQLVLQSQYRIPAYSGPSSLNPGTNTVRKSDRVQSLPQPTRTETPSEATDPPTSDVTFSSVTTAADMEIALEQSKDEQIVNEALLRLLNALTVHLPNLHCAWSPFRSPFNKATFGDKVMVALTDGCLETDAFPEKFAITEVKPTVRNRGHSPELYWQETAEVVAWILHDKQNARSTRLPRRMIISQNNHEIFITLASFDKRYVQYLQDMLPPPTSPRRSGRRRRPPQSHARSRSPPPPPPPPPTPSLPFITMQEYGPWNIQHPSHMQKLGRIIVALALETSDIIATTLAKSSGAKQG